MSPGAVSGRRTRTLTSVFARGRGACEDHHRVLRGRVGDPGETTWGTPMKDARTPRSRSYWDHNVAAGQRDRGKTGSPPPTADAGEEGLFEHYRPTHTTGLTAPTGAPTTTRTVGASTDTSGRYRARGAGSGFPDYDRLVGRSASSPNRMRSVAPVL